MVHLQEEQLKNLNDFTGIFGKTNGDKSWKTEDFPIISPQKIYEYNWANYPLRLSIVATKNIT